MRIPLLSGFPRPLLFAHRGLSWKYPENTMASFSAARDAGVPGIELDVHLSADGKLMVFHDDTTGRIVKAKPGIHRLEDSDSATLRSLDIGAWKGAEFAGETMPFLDEVLEEFGEAVYFDVEIKSRTVPDMGLEAILVRTLKDHRMEGRCLVSSFNPFSLRRFKSLCREIPAAIIWSDSKELYWFLRRGEGRWICGADVLKPEHLLLKPGKRIFSGARPLLPWTVDTEEDAARALGAGAQGIVSNRADLLLHLCGAGKSSRA